MKTLFAETALTQSGWARDLRISVAPSGEIVGCEPNASAEGAERLKGTVIPGMPNLHSHAFQRAMAGLTEHTTGAADSFWTWRETMYGFLAKLAPEDVRAIAAQLYVEMVKAGYTAVGEFHYLHHDPEGKPYADRTLLSESVIAAAGDAGIGLTLLPTYYQAGGFGGAPAGAGQRRFLNTADEILAMIATLRARHGGNPNLRLGLALHSLRAVPPEALAPVVASLKAADATAPIHIHVAEQVKEVEDCLAWSGQRPVEYLLDHAPVDPHWCLVHATHMMAGETQRLAGTGAVAGLCLTTEGNLGDGFFSAPGFIAAGGRWGVGSDSHISVSPIEELRWLEYGQRLLARRRNLATAGQAGSTGMALWQAALAGGAAALGRPLGKIAPGHRADLVVLDDASPALYGRAGDRIVDALVFAADLRAIRDVMVGGAWVVREGRHIREDAIAAVYKTTIDRLAP
ncbi:MAG: formimidoylglutamate deiminase [Alphaproteobacteria bacterium]|nr:formimidoylglutamate deiminase [Alphaproteobacteria bacterium]